MWGSSPLTRGKLRSICTRTLVLGLIPAHAGKTVAAWLACVACAAHPRSRGENTWGDSPSSYQFGSSPLTRGKRTETWGWYPETRLIPAHAGKTGRMVPVLRAARAHPRSRGENEIARAEDVNGNGSSPLTRGKRRLASMLTAHSRLIPAHAGKTCRDPSSESQDPAHPRSRGENLLLAVGVALHLGSSPLTRGKPPFGRRGSTSPRLIPAHAGKTGASRRRPRTSGAHPRSRGENVFMMVVVATDTGSSPLTRGKRLHDGCRSYRHRLIPAHAGKTTPSPRGSSKSTAHPRSRGENRTRFDTMKSRCGSSPLTRGKPTNVLLELQHERLIPAHAGKTLVRTQLHTPRSAHPRSRGENNPR